MYRICLTRETVKFHCSKNLTLF